MAALVRWAPFRDLDTIERRMRRVFEDAGLGPLAMPAADVYETDGEWVVELEVPGYAEKDLGIEVSDRTLVVKGAIEEAKEEKEKTFHLRERLERSFERAFRLPQEANAEKVVATFKNGVLEVRAPKAAQATPRKVAIGASKPTK
jgi:HSP20 family protein